MPKKLDLTGQKYGRLQVIKEVQDNRTGVYYLCRCECGNEKIIAGRYLNTGRTKSCGCFRKDFASQIGRNNIKHGCKNHPLYNTHKLMMRRCYDKNAREYKDYGGRGIAMYKEWKGNPAAFIEWIEANLGHKPSSSHSLDRIDNDGDYAPGNVRWATREEQQRNSRNAKLNEEDVRRMRELYKQGMRICDIWRMHYSHLYQNTIGNIIHYKKWKDIV